VYLVRVGNVPSGGCSPLARRRSVASAAAALGDAYLIGAVGNGRPIGLHDAFECTAMEARPLADLGGAEMANSGHRERPSVATGSVARAAILRVSDLAAEVFEQLVPLLAGEVLEMKDGFNRPALEKTDRMPYGGCAVCGEAVNQPLDSCFRRCRGAG
jgi:hypothetical protein